MLSCVPMHKNRTGLKINLYNSSAVGWKSLPWQEMSAESQDGDLWYSGSNVYSASSSPMGMESVPFAAHSLTEEDAGGQE